MRRLDHLFPTNDSECIKIVKLWILTTNEDLWIKMSQFCKEQFVEIGIQELKNHYPGWSRKITYARRSTSLLQVFESMMNERSSVYWSQMYCNSPSAEEQYRSLSSSMVCLEESSLNAMDWNADIQSDISFSVTEAKWWMAVFVTICYI